MNVLLPAGGPILIDWSKARSGPASAELAMTWLLLASGAVGGPPWPMRTVASLFRRRMVAAFLARVDQEAVAATLPEVARWRLADPTVGPAEAARVRAQAGQVAGGS
jgi:hypothetical protein